MDDYPCLNSLMKLYKDDIQCGNDKFVVLFAYYLMTHGFTINSTSEVEILDFTRFDTSVEIQFLKGGFQYVAMLTSTDKGLKYVICIKLVASTNKYTLELKPETYLENGSLKNIEGFINEQTTLFKSLQEKEFSCSQTLLSCPFCHRGL